MIMYVRSDVKAMKTRGIQQVIIIFISSESPRCSSATHAMGYFIESTLRPCEFHRFFKVCVSVHVLDKGRISYSSVSFLGRGSQRRACHFLVHYAMAMKIKNQEKVSTVVKSIHSGCSSLEIHRISSESN